MFANRAQSRDGIRLKVLRACDRGCGKSFDDVVFRMSVAFPDRIGLTQIVRWGMLVQRITLEVFEIDV